MDMHRVVPAQGPRPRYSCGFFYDPAAQTALLRANGDGGGDAGNLGFTRDEDLVNPGIVNLLHKAGLPQDAAGVGALRALTFWECVRLAQRCQGARSVPFVAFCFTAPPGKYATQALDASSCGACVGGTLAGTSTAFS